MLRWFKKILGLTKPGKLIWDGSAHVPKMRKGKSMISDAINKTGARPGDTVVIDRFGHARIIDRPLSVAVDNTKVE